MSALNGNLAGNLADNLAGQPVATQIPSGWFAENVHSWFKAACSTLAILAYREALRILILVRQFGC